MQFGTTWEKVNITRKQSSATVLFITLARATGVSADFNTEDSGGQESHGAHEKADFCLGAREEGCLNSRSARRRQLDRDRQTIN